MRLQSVASAAAGFRFESTAVRTPSLHGGNIRLRNVCLLLLAILLMLPATASRAQLNSSVGAVDLTAVLNPSLAVAVSPSLVNFALVQNGAVTGDSPITITTAWVLRPSVGDVRLYAYFTAPTAALADGFGNNIPSANVSGSVNGAGFTPFTGTGPFAAGGSLLVFTQRIIGNNRNGRRVDTLNLQIDTTGLTLPAGNYTGVLRIQARAL